MACTYNPPKPQLTIQLTQIPVTTAAAALAGTAAVAAYLEAKLHISHDLNATGSLNNAAGTAQNWVAQKEAQGRLLVCHLIEDHALQNPDNLFLEFEDRSWTYAQFYSDIQRVGNWLMKDLGIQKGELVAIDGPNSPEYLLVWFAVDAIGAAMSFINCNLTGTALTHCVKLCDARFLIAERSVEALVEPCKEELREKGCEIVYYDQQWLEGLRDQTPIPRERSKAIKSGDLKGLIYTSGSRSNLHCVVGKRRKFADL
jgi:acyl-CoA synthetase (AMP-forming)/AMP-acid ligase II